MDVGTEQSLLEAGKGFILPQALPRLSLPLPLPPSLLALLELPDAQGSAALHSFPNLVCNISPLLSCGGAVLGGEAQLYTRVVNGVCLIHPMVAVRDRHLQQLAEQDPAQVKRFFELLLVSSPSSKGTPKCLPGLLRLQAAPESPFFAKVYWRPDGTIGSLLMHAKVHRLLAAALNGNPSWQQLDLGNMDILSCLGICAPTQCPEAIGIPCVGRLFSPAQHCQHHQVWFAPGLLENLPGASAHGNSSAPLLVPLTSSNRQVTVRHVVGLLADICVVQQVVAEPGDVEFLAPGSVVLSKPYNIQELLQLRGVVAYCPPRGAFAITKLKVDNLSDLLIGSDSDFTGCTQTSKPACSSEAQTFSWSDDSVAQRQVQDAPPGVPTTPSLLSSNSDWDLPQDATTSVCPRTFAYNGNTRDNYVDMPELPSSTLVDTKLADGFTEWDLLSLDSDPLDSLGTLELPPSASLDTNQFADSISTADHATLTPPNSICPDIDMLELPPPSRPLDTPSPMTTMETSRNLSCLCCCIKRTCKQWIENVGTAASSTQHQRAASSDKEACKTPFS